MRKLRVWFALTAGAALIMLLGRRLEEMAVLDQDNMGPRTRKS